MIKKYPQIAKDILSANYNCAQIAQRNGVGRSTVSKVFDSMLKSGDIKSDHFVEQKRERYYPSEQEMLKDPEYTTSGLIGEEMEMLNKGCPPGWSLF